MKGVSVLVTMLLITAMVISFIVMAYLWGLPLLQKSMDRAKYDSSLEKLKDIKRGVESTVKLGSESVDFTLDTGDVLMVYYDGSLGKTVVDLKVKVGSQLIPSRWVPVAGFFELPYHPEDPKKEVIGTYGMDTYGIIIGKNFGDRVELKLVLRSLIDEYGRYYAINLTCIYPCTAGSPGKHTIHFKKAGESINLTHTIINIQCWVE